MEDKVYIVTLHRHEDLEQFYNEMETNQFHLVMKRPTSRNTHYKMNKDQAEQLRQDPRVWGVELVETLQVRRQVNNTSWQKTGEFFKNSPTATNYQHTWFQWGHLHIAGDQVQRRKNGSWGDPDSNEIVNEQIDIFNDGRHVDVVICDDSIAVDAGEWINPNTGVNRFVDYQWFNELNTLVNSIDDDGQTEPTGTITYHSIANLPGDDYHGMHVAGTACGETYGWANRSNIYNIAVTSTWASGQKIGALLIFDYLRAFHRTKAVNPATGFRNPTISNHSYGGIIQMNNEANLLFSDVNNVFYRGTNYNAGNPGPSGWTQAGLETDFGVRFNLDAYPAYSTAIAADVADAVDEGVVVIGAAGNDNLMMDTPSGPDWNNTIDINGVGTIFYNRGAWPNTYDSKSYNVGALQDRRDFRRSVYTQFGPAVDIFAPGDAILSAYSSQGIQDAKYTANDYYAAISGTSMASPQIAGMAACLATGKPRFTNEDLRRYLNDTSIVGDMTFDVAGGALDDVTCRQGSPNLYPHLENPRPVAGFINERIGERNQRDPDNGLRFPRLPTFHRQAPQQTGGQTYNFTVGNSGASHYVITGTDSTTTHSSANDPTINCNVGDTLVFDVSASGHPFLIKTTATTGTGNQVTSGTITNNGASVGTITWDTTGVTAGTYYYICQFHGGMVGSIIIS